MRVCTHAFEDLTGGITGLVCRKCRARLDGDHAHTVLLRAIQPPLAALDARVAAAETALLTLGLHPCETCGAWLQPAAAGTFHLELDRGDLWLCAKCLDDKLDDEEDTVLFDTKLGAYRPSVAIAARRVALRLPSTDPLRASILASFPKAPKPLPRR